VEDGDTIALTAGTTTTEVVRNLRHRQSITVVTNTVNMAVELSQQKNISVFVTGGHLRGDWFSLVGATAARTIREFYLDKVFIGANAVDPAQGPMCYNAEEAAVNRAMVQQARKRILVADHTKFSAKASHRICSLKKIDVLVTEPFTAENGAFSNFDPAIGLLISPARSHPADSSASRSP
jgi:DeoR family transcriptional regulator of aga operon